VQKLDCRSVQKISLARGLRTVLIARPNGSVEPTAAVLVDYDNTPLTRGRVQYVIEQLYRRAGLRAAVPPGASVHALHDLELGSQHSRLAGLVDRAQGTLPEPSSRR